jgi:outer membrane protein assembly factor BamB
MNMKSLSTLLALALLALGSAAVHAEDPAPVKHRIMFFEYGNTQNRLVELDADGKIVFEHKPITVAVMFIPLPNGNIMYGYGGQPTGVVEIDHDQKQVWRYDSKCPQLFCFTLRSNGNIVLAEQGPPQALEVNRNKEVVHTTPLVTSDAHTHQQVRNIQVLENGNVVAGHEGEGAAREVDPTGKVVWEYKGVDNCGTALRLANGNTLIACGTQKRLIEVTPDGKIAWEFNEKDGPDLNLTWVASIQILKNGNYVVGNFLRGAEGKGAHAFEITHDKKIVWTFRDHEHFKSITTVRVLDDK